MYRLQDYTWFLRRRVGIMATLERPRNPPPILTVKGGLRRKQVILLSVIFTLCD